MIIHNVEEDQLLKKNIFFKKDARYIVYILKGEIVHKSCYLAEKFIEENSQNMAIQDLLKEVREKYNVNIKLLKKENTYEICRYVTYELIISNKYNIIEISEEYIENINCINAKDYIEKNSERIKLETLLKRARNKYQVVIEKVTDQFGICKLVISKKQKKESQ